MTELATGAPARAPGVELLGELAGSGYEDAPGLVRRGDGQTVQVTTLLYQLLEVVDGERGLEELAAALGERCGKDVAADDVRYLLEEKLAPLGLLGGAGDDGPAPEKQTPLLGLRPKIVVTDPEVTRRVTGPFAVLFRPWIVAPVLVGAIVTCWWVLWERGLASATRQAFDSPGLLLAVFGLTVVSAGWHEFGHAAACRAMGATPGAMGAGLYVVWPAFYTDVDDSYRLSRWGRLVVDLGGLYFNLVVAVAVGGLWFVTRIEPLLIVVAMQMLLMLRQLAPVVRADGYHILADLTGVPDLFRHIVPTLAGLLPWRWGQPQPLRPWARWVVRAWVFIVVPLLLSMLLTGVVLFPRLLATAWTGMQLGGRRIFSAGADGDLLGVLAALLRLVSVMLPAVAVGYQLQRIVRRVVRSVIRRTDGRPLWRAGSALAAVLLVALLLAAWWPKGQYQPVHADERGTLRSILDPSAVRASASRPLPGIRPRTAYALVPRKAGAPAMLLVQREDGTMQSVLTDGGGARSGTAVPFTLPDAPRPGDTQALAVNGTDGAVVYDVAVALVWVTDGQPVDNRNEAYALASCTGCTTVAVSFQVLLIVGETNRIAPVNVAVAANGGCTACTTTTLAVQLVLTLDEMPDAAVRAQIEDAMARLDDLRSLPDPYGQIKAVEREIVTILTDNGLVDADAGVLSDTTSDQPDPAPVPTSTSTSTSAPGGATTTTGGGSSTTSTSRPTTSTTRGGTTTTVRTTSTSTAQTTTTRGGTSSTTTPTTSAG